MLEWAFSAEASYEWAVRVLLAELGLAYAAFQPNGAPTQEQLGAEAPTMQVPTMRDGTRVLWESGVIAEYLLASTSDRHEGDPPRALALYHDGREWAGSGHLLQRERMSALGRLRIWAKAAKTMSQYQQFTGTMRSRHLKDQNLRTRQ